MGIVGDVVAELFGMFVSDAGLTIAIAIVVGAAMILTDVFAFPAFGGAILLCGSLAVVVVSVGREAVKRR